MTKRLFVFLIVSAIVFIISLSVNSYVVKNQPDIGLSFALIGVYLFHFIASIIVYLLLELTVKYVPKNAGYLYLASVFIKMGVFFLVFQELFYDTKTLNKAEKVSLIAPLFIFLFLETAFASKLLNSILFTPKTHKKVS